MFSMLELEEGQKVLEVGSGCGYALALLSEIVGKEEKVFGIEIIKDLSEKSKKNLEKYKNTRVHLGDGKLGWKEKSPFDRILISASCSEIPKPLISQLKGGGILVAPIGNKFNQTITAFKKTSGKLKITEELPGFVFVPLVD